MRIVPISVKLVHATENPERVIEQMGRICYQSSHKVERCGICLGSGEGDPSNYDDFDDGPCTDPPVGKCIYCNGTGTDAESANRFVRMVIARGHESVLEHVSAGFSIVTDRGVTHELVRHRIAVFSQESTRYCDYSGDRFGGELSFIRPRVGTTDSAETLMWENAVSNCEEAYKFLRVGEVPPELARSVLPTCLKAEIGMTANAHEWRHILRLRLAKTAHPQMREVMRLVAAELVRWSPVLFEDIKEIQ